MVSDRDNTSVSREYILLVEGDEELRTFLTEEVLKPEGYIVEAVSSGSWGLSVALESQPDLIVADYLTPELGGLEMVEKLRQLGHQTPVVLMAENGAEDAAIRALRAGVMDYLVKPFAPEDLRRTVRRVLHTTQVGTVRTSVPDQKRLQAMNILLAVGKAVTSTSDPDLILTRVVEAAVLLTETEEGTLMLIDPETQDLYVRASKNMDAGLVSMRLRTKDSLAGHVVSTGKPLLISGEGMQKIKTQYLVQSLLYVPIQSNKQVIGVLGVFNRYARHDIPKSVVGLMVMLADYAAIAITNAEEYSKAQAEATRLHHIFHQMKAPAIAVNDQGRIILSNQAAEILLSEPGRQMTGQNLLDVISHKRLLELLNPENRNPPVLDEIELEDGSIYQAQITDAAGLGRVVILQNITELKELDRIKSEMIMNISHDLRSPLTAILSYVELMSRTGELNPQQVIFSNEVRQNVRTITQLIDELLSMETIEAGLAHQFEVLSLTEIIHEAIEFVRSKANIKHLHLRFDASSSLPGVQGIPLRLRQVFVNLIDNAIKYTPAGGAIHISLFEETGQVVACVSDTGIGISREEQQHIFDKFYRSERVTQNYEGTGLGLSIVKSIIDGHNGRIWVDSTIGEGTTFTVMLPAFVSE